LPKDAHYEPGSFTARFFYLKNFIYQFGEIIFNTYKHSLGNLKRRFTNLNADSLAMFGNLFLPLSFFQNKNL